MPFQEQHWCRIERLADYGARSPLLKTAPTHSAEFHEGTERRRHGLLTVALSTLVQRSVERYIFYDEAKFCSQLALSFREQFSSTLGTADLPWVLVYHGLIHEERAIYTSRYFNSKTAPPLPEAALERTAAFSLSAMQRTLIFPQQTGMHSLIQDSCIVEVSRNPAFVNHIQKWRARLVRPDCDDKSPFS